MKTAEDIIREKSREIVWIRGDESVFEAARLMVDANIGAILIKEGDRLVGIFSERDLLRITVEPGFDPKTQPVGRYMSSPLHTVPHDTPLIKLTEKFLGLFIRHLMVEKGEEPLGMLSIGDALRASLLEQDVKIRELNQIASWEYYENWGWDRKR